jgi:hypothetical protein
MGGGEEDDRKAVRDMDRRQDDRRSSTGGGCWHRGGSWRQLCAGDGGASVLAPPADRSDPNADNAAIQPEPLDALPTELTAGVSATAAPATCCRWPVGAGGDGVATAMNRGRKKAGPATTASVTRRPSSPSSDRLNARGGPPPPPTWSKSRPARSNGVEALDGRSRGAVCGGCREAGRSGEMSVPELPAGDCEDREWRGLSDRGAAVWSVSAGLAGLRAATRAGGVVGDATAGTGCRRDGGSGVTLRRSGGERASGEGRPSGEDPATGGKRLLAATTGPSSWGDCSRERSWETAAAPLRAAGWGEPGVSPPSVDAAAELIQTELEGVLSADNDAGDGVFTGARLEDRAARPPCLPCASTVRQADGSSGSGPLRSPLSGAASCSVATGDAGLSARRGVPPAAVLKGALRGRGLPPNGPADPPCIEDPGDLDCLLLCLPEPPCRGPEPGPPLPAVDRFCRRCSSCRAPRSCASVAPRSSAASMASCSFAMLPA